MINLLKRSATWALSVITVVFTFVPETIFGKCKLSDTSDEVNIILARVLAFILVLVLSTIINALYLWRRKSVCIKGHNYSVKIEYGDLFEMSTCKKVITFDECFTTKVGTSPGDVKSNSICGQYLTKYPLTAQDMQHLIDVAQLAPAKGKSKYRGNIRYDSGKLVPKDDYLLMAFARLDTDGLGRFFSYEEFLACLSILWKEIDKYYEQNDVCIPILGSGLTRIGDTSFTHQELLDIIIGSYKLSPHKLRYPYQLHIVCKDNSISLNKISVNG